jgi:hypothetical protein
MQLDHKVIVVELATGGERDAEGWAVSTISERLPEAEQMVLVQ